MARFFGERILLTTNVDGVANIIDVNTKQVVQKVPVPTASRRWGSPSRRYSPAMLMRVLAIIFNALPVRWQRRSMTAGLIPAALS